MKNNEDQIVLIGEIKKCRNNPDREIITTILTLGIVKLALIINVPQDEDETVKIYVKPAGNGSNKTRDNYQPNRVADKQDARSNADDEYDFIPGTDPIL